MARNEVIVIPPAPDVESLRKQTVVQLNRLSTRLAQSDQRSAPMDMGYNRIVNVPDPANPLDAVNLRTLKSSIEGLGHRQKQPQPPGPLAYFGIVWANGGTIGAGVTPPYIFLPHRLGTPNMVKAFALTTGSGGTATMNVIYLPGGTGSSTALLATNLTLSGAAPVSSTSFISSIPSFQANDVVYGTLIGVGNQSNFVLELLVAP